MREFLQSAPHLGVAFEGRGETRCGGQLVPVPQECALKRLRKFVRRAPAAKLRVQIRLPLGDPGPPPRKTCDDLLADGAGSRAIQGEAQQLDPFGVIRPRFDSIEALERCPPTDRPWSWTPLRTRRRRAATGDPSSPVPPPVRPVSLGVSAPHRPCA